MAREKLTHPDQPLLVRSLLWLYEFLASLKLAVILIFSLAGVLAFATFVESNLGTAAVQWYVYHSNAFMVLLALLAVNIFCAASIRYPWKRHQTGFVVTHVGLLVLLFGSVVSYRGSLNSQMLVYQGDSSQFAIDMDEGTLVFNNLPGRPEPLRYRFRPGPFNWQDHEPYPIVRRLKSWIGLDDPSQTWEHPPETVYEDEQTKIEIVDFYSRSEVRRVPYVGLVFRQTEMNFEIPVDLEYDHSLQFAESDFQGLGSVMMWQTEKDFGLEAFRECVPERTVDGDGAVVMWFDGEVHHLRIAELQRLKEAGQSYPLDDRTEVEFVSYVPWANISRLLGGDGLVSQGNEPKMPAVELKVVQTNDGKTTNYRVIRFARFPFMPNRAEPDRFLAEFYHPEVPGRVDILLGPDEQFAFRAWQQKPRRVVAAGELAKGEEVKTWSMGGGEATWQMALKDYTLPEEDGETVRVIPLEFDKDERGISKRVQLRITSTDPNTKRKEVDEFWLRQNLPPPWESRNRAQIQKTRLASGETVEASYNVQETDVGFAVKLVDFDLDVDPGTRTAANYTSYVVQVDVRNTPEIQELQQQFRNESDRQKKQELRDEIDALSKRLIDQHLAQLEDRSPEELKELVDSEEALLSHVITMNEPLDYPDWEGRVLRFFQENYLAPEGQHPLGSIFRVNYDPGRPIKYLGSLLICVGIFLMFYMRAYFFKGSASRPTGPVPAKVPGRSKKSKAGSTA